MNSENREHINVITLTELAVSEHFPESYEQENLERCPECGSSLFRIYKEDVPEGSYDQFICAVCNHRWGGYLNRFKEGNIIKIDENKIKKTNEQIRRNIHE